MFAKNFADAARVNDCLSAMKRDGFIDATHQKWFGSAAAPGSSSVTVMDSPKP
jgi:polar amino acid transport system substrate-binding protein